MSLPQNLALFIVDTLASLYVLLLVLRCLLAQAQADFYNPLSQVIVRLTAKPIVYMHQALPPIGHFDIACWLYAYAIKSLSLFLLAHIQGAAVAWSAVLPFALIALLELVVHIYIVALVVGAIASWFTGGVRMHPALSLVSELTEPLLAPLRRMLPSASGIDFSPLAAIFLLYIVLIVLRALH